MAESTLEHAAVSITTGALVLLVGAILPFSTATAEPIELNGVIPLGAGSVSGSLRGDLTKNILTLNSSSPSSKISIDTAASGPLPPSILPGTLTYTQEFLIESPFGNTDSVSYNVEFTITPHLSANLIVPTWHFGIAGNVNLEVGTTELTAVPQAPATIGTVNAFSMPIFSGRITTNLDPVVASLAQAALNTTLLELNSSGTKLNLSITGEWEKLSIGSATMTFTQTKPNININLNLTSAILAGKFNYNVDLSFSSPTNSFIGSNFEEEIEGFIEDELMDRLLNYIDHEFDREVNGKIGTYRQNCSGQQLGVTRIGTSCNINTQFTLTPNLF